MARIVHSLPQTTAAFNQVLRAQASENSDPMQNLRSLRLRYFSPRELLRLLHFEPPGDPQTQPFVWPSNVTTKTKYRLIGNSVNVKVVTELIDFLFE
jgi:tRNA (cytosine38-C5)-methyltransferase